MLYVIVSLLSGLASWNVAFLNIKVKDPKQSKQYIVLSFSFCLLSVYSQILMMWFDGEEKWSLIIDALGALHSVLPIFFLVTIVLNLIAIYRQHREQ